MSSNLTTFFEVEWSKVVAATSGTLFSTGRVRSSSAIPGYFNWMAFGVGNLSKIYAPITILPQSFFSIFVDALPHSQGLSFSGHHTIGFTSCCQPLPSDRMDHSLITFVASTRCNSSSIHTQSTSNDGQNSYTLMDNPRTHNNLNSLS
jgi:hypothetical protein